MLTERTHQSYFGNLPEIRPEAWAIIGCPPRRLPPALFVDLSQELIDNRIHLGFGALPFEGR